MVKIRFRPLIEKAAVFCWALPWVLAGKIDAWLDARDHVRAFDALVGPSLKRSARKKSSRARIDASVVTRGGHA